MAVLREFNDTTWTFYDSSNYGLPGKTITSIAIDGSENKWIGAENTYFDYEYEEEHTIGCGLAKFDGITWTVYNDTNSGLPNNTVTSIAIDGSGNKWIGTDFGLAVFSGGNSAIKMNHGPVLKRLSPLCWNYPNPFKQKTLINYNVVENGPVSLRVYSLDGHLIQTLVNAKQTIGHYSVSWDGKNDAGKLMSHGVYLYRLTSNSGNISKKMNFIE